MKPISTNQNDPDTTNSPITSSPSILAAATTTTQSIDLRYSSDKKRQLLDRQSLSEHNEDFIERINKDDPKPAVFVARKLFCDFVHSIDRKVDNILGQEAKNKPIYKSLQPGEDPIYDRVLEALGSISEFCLPSMLTSLLEWYHHQLNIGDREAQKRPQSLPSDYQHPPLLLHNLHDNYASESQQSDCGSPCNDTLAGNSLTIRSPTPSPPDTASNQVSITSTLPLDYQSTSLTLVTEQQQQHSSSAANTSNSTATNVSSQSLTEVDSSTNGVKRSELLKIRKILIEYSFCQALIEIFNQLYLHPGHEDLIGQIEDIAFEHFRHLEVGSNYSAQDLIHLNQLADKYAEVIGVLAGPRFKKVKKRFTYELNTLKSKEPTPHNVQCIVTLLSSIKYFRVKMAPIEEFEASLQFLQELAEYFLEVRHKSVRHALASLFVEILVPLGASVKNEVKIPCLKNFVDTLWSQTLDMCSRKKHSIIVFPLVTCLLCVSQRSFFLTNWGVFLNMCLSNLKNRDPKMCQVALESLYRLIWIYMIRVGCESNNVTQSRLTSVVDTIFPRGSRSVTPRDSSLNLFVDMIHFIAQERLDFAMRNIIFDLLSVDRQFKVITAPERMNIGIQAFLVIADSLQQKDGDPSMPNTVCIAASNAIRRAHVNKILSDETAKAIGLYPYHNQIQRSFNDILKALDNQFGKPMLLTNTHNTNKELDLLSSERKPKIELFRTCIAAIPRIIPDGMSRSDLIDLLSRMTVHVDEGMRKQASETLQLIVTDYADWRLDAIEGFTIFLINQIDESLRHLVDGAMKMLLQLLISWRNTITPNHSGAQGDQRAISTVNIQSGYETISSRTGSTGGQIAARKNKALAEMRLIQSELSTIRFEKLVGVIQKVESASLVMLCSGHQQTRKIASHLLRECRSILKNYSAWICMEQFGLKSPDELDEEDLTFGLKASLSADNLSRITTTSANGPVHSSATSMNTQVAALSTSASKTCITGNQSQHQQHDLYDDDSAIEENLIDCFSGDGNSSLVFWLAVMLLESELEKEYVFALRLLRKILPNLPFEQQSFLDEINKNLEKMRWKNFPGIHSLVLKGCKSSATYEICITLLDQLTPILKLPICSGAKSDQLQSPDCDVFPSHVLVLLTHLLSSYDDPSASSLNIARRLALWCDESSQKLENLSAVMSLYSRRCFSKDSFQWTKCVVKYLYDAYSPVLPKILPMLVDILESGPRQAQRMIAPILFCILTYVDMTSPSWDDIDGFNAQLTRFYVKYLNGDQWRDAIQIIKLMISRSSYLANSTSVNRGELPGRTMDFTLDVESIPLIAKGRLIELMPASSSSLVATDSVPPASSVEPADFSATTSSNCNSTDSQAGEQGEAPAASSLATAATVPSGATGAAVAATTATATADSVQSVQAEQQQQENLAEQKQLDLVVGQQQASEQKQRQQQQPTKWRKSWLSQRQTRQRLVELLLDEGLLLDASDA